MTNEITLNGEVYVLKSTIKKEGIIDRESVGVLIQRPNGFDGIVTTTYPPLNFRLSFKDDDEDILYNIRKGYMITKNGTKIGIEQLKKYKRIINLFDSRKLDSEGFDIFEAINDSGDFKKDVPVLLVKGEYGIVIAPRADR